MTIQLNYFKNKKPWSVKRALTFQFKKTTTNVKCEPFKNINIKMYD
jgi:hypothetical protein